jgi:D-mannonate dehydratase
MSGGFPNITYFLKKVIPVCEKANVRMALHPNDPPAPVSRGSQQTMGTVEGWKKLIDVVKSPCSGITFDCGVTREMGGAQSQSAAISHPATASTTCTSVRERS